jgi:hypothetical protein
VRENARTIFPHRGIERPHNRSATIFRTPGLHHNLSAPHLSAPLGSAEKEENDTEELLSLICRRVNADQSEVRVVTHSHLQPFILTTLNHADLLRYIALGLGIPDRAVMDGFG